MTAFVGIVYYADDPDKKVFRQVIPQPDDAPDILDDPKWITDGVDPSRTAVMDKVSPDEAMARKMFGPPNDMPPTTNGIDANGNPWPPVDSGG